MAGTHYALTSDAEFFFAADLHKVILVRIDARRGAWKMAPIAFIHGEARPDYAAAFECFPEDLRAVDC